MAGVSTKSERGDETRELIMLTAERLFAEHGIAAVSNRQISEAAGQANNFAVGYHFGTKADLVLAIARWRFAAMEQRRLEILASIAGSTELRDWISCLVLPVTEHLAELGNPTWYGRFTAQVTTDPVLRRLVIDETISTPSLQASVDGISRLRPAMPAPVQAERADMCRQLIVHTCAERERALQEGTPTPRATWQETAVGLIDAIAGLWLAPITATA